jgi:hypothetical protein
MTGIATRRILAVRSVVVVVGSVMLFVVFTTGCHNTP